MDRPLVLGLGEALWDRDRMRGERTPGGAPINFAYYATRHGMRGVALSAIGRDARGEELKTYYAKHGIQTELVEVDWPTGWAETYLDEAGEQRFTIGEEVAYDHIPATPRFEELARVASAVCFGTLACRTLTSRRTIEYLLSLTPASALRIYDINLRPPHFTPELIEGLLRRANVLKLNAEELQVLRTLYPLPLDEEAACRWLMEQNDLRMVVLTAGADYSAIYTSEQSSVLPTPTVEPDDEADTVGAGDAFTGTLVASLLRGLPLAKAHQESIREAAEVCRIRGAWR